MDGTSACLKRKGTIFMAAVTRYGPRYGRTIRERLGKVEKQYKGRHKCPYCSYETARREAAGIWSCGKCGAKFTSRAYELRKRPAMKSSTEEEDV